MKIRVKYKNFSGSNCYMSTINQYCIDDVLNAARKQGVSDVHITVGAPPTFRIDGRLVKQSAYSPVDKETAERLVYSMLLDSQKCDFESNNQLDFSYPHSEAGCFRVNIYRQKGNVAAAMRCIPYIIPTAEELNIPKYIEKYFSVNQGLILVTGPTGCGKSTTMAAMSAHVCIL